MSETQYRVGPDGEEYYFPLNENGRDVGDYGYREGEITGSFKGNTTSAVYITNGYSVYRCAGIMYMEVPESEYELQETLEGWLENDDEVELVFGEADDQ
jgi:hypothetical protein